jgi:hypothetical protein
MGKAVVQGMVETRKQHPLTVLLVILVGVLAVSPALEAELFHPLLVQLGFSVLLLVAGWACSARRREFVGIAIVIAAILVCTWVGYFHPTRATLIAKPAVAAVFCFLVLVITARRVFAGGAVTPDTIAGGVAVYLLAGFAFACMFAMADLIHPGSLRLGPGFTVPGTQPVASGHVLPFIYYSFVTLLTVGYGDVTAGTSETRILAVLEALVGQLYLAVLIGRLVGAYVSVRHGRKE